MKNLNHVSSLTILKERARVCIFLVAGTAICIFISLGVLMLLPEFYEEYIPILLPMIMIIAYVASIIFRKPGSIETIYDTLEDSSVKHPVISVMYLNYLRHKYTRIALLLVLVSFASSISLFVADIEKIILSTNFIILIYAILILIRLKLAEIRVKSGSFGDTPEETVELIKFILNHSIDIDFTDNNGTPKRCFLPETLLSLEDSPSGEKVAI